MIHSVIPEDQILHDNMDFNDEQTLRFRDPSPLYDREEYAARGDRNRTKTGPLLYRNHSTNLWVYLDEMTIPEYFLNF